MKKLLNLLKLKENELKIMLYNYLYKKDMFPTFEDGYVYAKGNIPLLLVAHMDTVSEHPPKQIKYSKFDSRIYTNSEYLGGDDRCGIYAILEILNKYKPHVLFTEDEEIGCLGAIKATKKLDKPDVKYIIEFDRTGSNDCVFYDCGNEEFIKYIESFGFKTNYGTYTDISILGSTWNIASVNLSSGYYKEHTKEEYILLNELKNNINRVKKMIDNLEKVKYFDYQEIDYTNNFSKLFYDLLLEENTYELKKLKKIRNKR